MRANTNVLIDYVPYMSMRVNFSTRDVCTEREERKRAAIRLRKLEFRHILLLKRVLLFEYKMYTTFHLTMTLWMF